jgi:hypothetical protein
MIKVYFEDTKHICADLVAVFDDEESFNRCHAKLAGLAKESRQVVTTSMDEEMPLKDYADFMEQAYELAFGDDAIDGGYSPVEVLEKLREFSDKALAFDEEDESPAMRS